MPQNVTDALKRIQSQGSFTAKAKAALDDLQIDIKGTGALTFPLKPAMVKSMIKCARPAKFGWREETRMDTEVRDVWELPKSAVKIDKRRWNKTLNPMLAQLKNDLGLPEQGKLKAELHNLLVYETGQFFLPHQDSEKSDGMIATLVVVLPSSYRGGSLVVDHQGEKKRFTSTSTPADKLTFIAFYTDCHHEVRPVTKGYRVVLTYNLVLENAESSTDLSVKNDTQQALSTAVLEYLTRAPEEKSRCSATCQKLVYLLDHEYTAKGLHWNALKNGDGLRAKALLAVAKAQDLEIYLGLVDIHTTWSCEDDNDWGYSRGYSRRNRYWDHMDENNGDNVSLIDLIDESTSIRHWLDANGQSKKLPEMFVRNGICWTKATDDFEPFESEYEGWTGNAGNTMDRWYHRAGIVVWRRVDHYAVQLAWNTTKAIAEIAKLTQRKATLPQVQPIIQNLIPYWAGLPQDEGVTSFSRVLNIALKLNNAELASAFIAPLGIMALRVETVAELVKLEQTYGAPWCIAAMQAWVLPKGYRYSAAIDNLANIIKKWVATAPDQHQIICHWMLTFELNRLKRDIHTAYQQPGLEAWNSVALTQDVMHRLTAEIDQGLRAANDWAILDKNTCACTDCKVLREFLQSSTAQQKIWPLAEGRRDHIGHTIDAMRLPVTHRTERTGRPYKLKLRKTEALFTEAKARFDQCKKALNAIKRLLV